MDWRLFVFLQGSSQPTGGLNAIRMEEIDNYISILLRR